jgi:hypothetical protein
MRHRSGLNYTGPLNRMINLPETDPEKEGVKTGKLE